MSITIPDLINAQVVVMKAGAPYTNTSVLIGKTVCAEAGSAGEGVIIGEDADENLLKATYVAKDVQTSCLMEVKAGTADAAVLDLTLAKAMIGAGTDYSDLEIKDYLAEEEYGVAFRKGSNLCEKVNAIFGELTADGTMQKLADKYDLALTK
jgi:polar amino acid transport system substrate-binding protein